MTLVDVWRVDTREPFDDQLDDAERARCAALRDPADRRRFAACHSALRRVAAACLGTDPAAVRWIRGPNGKPALDGHALQVNLSHAGDLALIAVTAARPVGVDLQDVVPGLDAAAMARRWFTGAEAGLVAADGPERFAQLWARKEAVVKAAGDRLTRGLALPVAGEPPPLVGHDGEPYALADLPAPAGFRAALALRGAEPFTVRMR